MKQDPVIHALTEQVACYRRLAKLAAVQRDHIQHARTEELLEVLQSRQAVVDQLAAHEKVIAPAKLRWNEYAGMRHRRRIASANRPKLCWPRREALLEKITSAVTATTCWCLQQQEAGRTSASRSLKHQATVARQINRNYAAAAYGTGKPRMDLQM